MLQLNIFNFNTVSSFAAVNGNSERHNSVHSLIKNWNLFSPATTLIHYAVGKYSIDTLSLTLSLCIIDFQILCLF